MCLTLEQCWTDRLSPSSFGCVSSKVQNILAQNLSCLQKLSVEGTRWWRGGEVFSSLSWSQTLRKYPGTPSVQLFSTTANLCIRLIYFPWISLTLIYLTTARPVGKLLLLLLLLSLLLVWSPLLPNQFQLQPSTQSDCRPASRDKEQLAGGVAATRPALLREATVSQKDSSDAVTAAHFRHDTSVERRFSGRDKVSSVSQSVSQICVSFKKQ